VSPRNQPVGSRNPRGGPHRASAPPRFPNTEKQTKHTEMKNELANRQNMHLAVVALLGDPNHQAA
jgi:hypothetical protein